MLGRCLKVPGTSSATTLEDLTGHRPATLGAPRWVALAVAALVELGAAVTRREPSLTRDLVRASFEAYLTFDTAKVRGELGLRPRPALDVLADTIRWLLSQGAVRSDRAAELGRRLLPDLSLERAV